MMYLNRTHDGKFGATKQRRLCSCSPTRRDAAITTCSSSGCFPRSRSRMRVSSAERLVKSDTLASRTSRSLLDTSFGRTLAASSGLSSVRKRVILHFSLFVSLCFDNVMLLGSEALPVLRDQGDIILE